MEHEIPASQKDRGLPMIINLRGDEDLVEEFNWDADQVMEFLGIKRSRLTQISGKELRVARIRRDRYLRPIYRESDVRDYQELTRATATHQSSSRAIEQAIDSLDDRFSDILVVLQEKLVQYEDRSSELLRKQLHRLDQEEFARFQTLRDQGENQQSAAERHERMQSLVLQQLLAQKGKFEAERREIQELRGLFSSFHQDVRALIVAQQALRREIEESRSEWRQLAESQAEALEAQKRVFTEALEALAAGQRQILQQTEKEPPAPAPAPIMKRGQRQTHAKRRIQQRRSRPAEA